MTNSNGNGHRKESESDTQYEHLQNDQWIKYEEDRAYFTDSQAMKDEISDDDDDSSDDRN